jgi:NAD(P)-dependent dehydrogenase (short-subunit alcohol dehydrogenase family)
MANNYLVVGGTSGIGAEVIRLLLDRGSAVVQLSRHPEQAVDAPGVRSLAWDATDEGWPADALPERLDGLVYCPGSIRLKPFPRIRPDELREDLELNLIGAVRAIQGALPALQRAPRASVVLFSTVAAQTGMPFHASVAAAKGAVEGLTRSLAAELAPMIRVNAIAPTVTDTRLAARLLGSAEKRQTAADRHPLKRVNEPDEVARTVFWLLDDAPSVTGQVIAVDGGLGALRLL